MKEKPVFMVGAFPPPVMGLASVNAAMRDGITKFGMNVVVSNLAAKNLGRSFIVRLQRGVKVFLTLFHFIGLAHKKKASLYISVSGSFGQLYEVMFIVCARLFDMRIYLHHHSFAYLNQYSFLTSILTRVAGVSATHITQSKYMADVLQKKYRIVRNTFSISNAVFLETDVLMSSHGKKLQTIGFLSNICEDKGVFEFLDLVEACESRGYNLNAVLAGPFQDSATERKVQNRMLSLNMVKYIGPIYGKEKDFFLRSIDVLIFPTKYKNETEGIVNHEAMSYGVPVIAYGRGCISEIIGEGAGLVVAIDVAFVPLAMHQIDEWMRFPHKLFVASELAQKCFIATKCDSKIELERLLTKISVADCT